MFLLQLRIYKLFKGGNTLIFYYYLIPTIRFLLINNLCIEKFDDIKFGKVLTKLYARIFTMESVKYLPPKYSHAMKDLATYLGIYEITED